MKKIILLTGLFISIIFSTSAQSIALNKKGLFVNKISMSKSWQLIDFKNQLGSPERNRDGYNKTHTYDSKGLVVFEGVKNKEVTGSVNEFQVHFYVAEPNEVTPKGTFSGDATFNKLKLTKATSYSQVLKNLKEWNKTESYLEHSYRYASGGIYVYFHFNESETELNKISVGPDKK